MTKAKTEKIYCYVDETGQDTKGYLFIVAIVVADQQKDQLENKLLAIENSSGKHARKWQKTRKQERINYIQAVLALDELKQKLFYKDYADAGRQYLYLIVYALAELVISLFKNKKVSVTIDALTKKQRNTVAVELRHFGITTDTINGKRDESSAFLRLADAVAGFARDGVEGHSDYVKIFNGAIRKGMIKKIK